MPRTVLGAYLEINIQNELRAFLELRSTAYVDIGGW